MRGYLAAASNIPFEEDSSFGNEIATLRSQ